MVLALNILEGTFFLSVSAEGHDSVEDSISCMELMLWKIAQDLKSSSSTR